MAQGVPAREASRRAVRESLLIALEASFSRCSNLWIYSAFALVLGLLALMVWSWGVYQNHSSDYCDQPLALMLRLFYFIVCLYGLQKEILRCFLCYDPARNPIEPPRVKAFKYFVYIATVIWPLVATWMLSQTQICSSDLRNVVQTIVWYYTVTAFVVIVMPVCIISVMLCLVRRGLVRAPRNQQAAPEGFIDQLPVVQYEPSLFGDQLDSYASACPICLDSFDAEQTIVRTPCAGRGHVFHKQCLDNWLRCSRACPLCRTDLTDPESSS